MTALWTIGEFSRVTLLSVKALRHYDDVGLLPPADVDRATGYRLYANAQVPAAHVIRRFRDLDMPLEQIKAVLDAEMPSVRDRVILEHLEHMQTRLEQTQATVASLHELLEGRGAPVSTEHRTLAPSRTLAIRGRVGWDDSEAWLVEVFNELHRAVDEADVERAGPDGALYTDEFFEAHIGDVIAFVPVGGAVAAIGRAQALELPAGEFAVTVHHGPFGDLDTTYGALGTYVTERALGAEGPIRENYLVTKADTDDATRWRTEVCWPIQPPAAAR